MNPPRNKLARRKHDLLLKLGYEYLGAGGGGHYRYEHPVHGAVFVSSTAYDRTAWQMFLSDMRRRHPASPHLRRRKSASTARRRTRRSKQMTPALRIVAAPEVAKVPVAPRVAEFAPTEPITDERRDEWRKKADELARLNAQSRLTAFPWRRSA